MRGIIVVCFVFVRLSTMTVTDNMMCSAYFCVLQRLMTDGDLYYITSTRPVMQQQTFLIWVFLETLTFNHGNCTLLLGWYNQMLLNKQWTLVPDAINQTVDLGYISVISGTETERDPQSDSNVYIQNHTKQYFWKCWQVTIYFSEHNSITVRSVELCQL